MSKIINEKELENVNGGYSVNTNIGSYYAPKLDIPTGQYSAGQKIRFVNPHNTSEELIGVIKQPPVCYDSEGFPVYSVNTITPEQKAQNMAANMYLVSEKYILEVIG